MAFERPRGPPSPPDAPRGTDAGGAWRTRSPACLPSLISAPAFRPRSHASDADVKGGGADSAFNGS